MSGLRVSGVAEIRSRGRAVSGPLSPDELSVAPLYDLVSTWAYPHLSRQLAMRMGSESDPGKLRRQATMLLRNLAL